MKSLVLCALLALVAACACAPGPTPAPFSPTNRIRVTIITGGWLRLKAEALRSVGLDLSQVDPASVQVYDGPVQVPALRSREGIEFYARMDSAPLLGDMTYWLHWGEGQAMAWKDRDGAPSAGSTVNTYVGPVTAESNELYIPQALETDRWFWQLLAAPTDTEIKFKLPEPASGLAQLDVVFWGASQDGEANPDHHVRLQWNGQAVGETRWDGRGSYTATVTLPDRAARAGENTLRIETPGDTGAKVDFLYLDRATVQLPQSLKAADDQIEFETGAPLVRVGGWKSDRVEAYDVTDPRAPVHLSGIKVEPAAEGRSVEFSTGAGRSSVRRFLLVGAPAAPRAQFKLAPMSNGALHESTLRGDEIMITVPELASELAPLAEWRKANGVQPVVVMIQQVYDEFSFGRADPTAIRSFLSFALENWKPAPRFALLVGKASYDIHDYVQGPNKNMVPTFLMPTPNLGQAASDNWFAARDDAEPAPRLAIGRIPARSPDQVKTAVAKIRAYETALRDEGAAPWRRRVVLVADGKEPQFATSLEALSRQLPASLEAVKILPKTDKSDLAARRTDILNAWNAGALLMTYIGHGSIDTWAEGPLLSSKDAANLANQNALPILLTPTCLDGFFYHPQQDSLAEQVLFNPRGGIVAGIVPTGLSLPQAQDQFVAEFTKEWFQAQTPWLGQAVMNAKVRIAGGGEDVLEVVETFVLLGDPALRLVAP